MVGSVRFAAELYLVHHAEDDSAAVNSFLYQFGLDSVDFSYTGATSPNNWGMLKPEYALCSSRKNQSPINIVQSNSLLNKFSAELHLFHKADDGITTVNGILYQNGNSHSKVDPILAKLHYNGDIGGIEINGKKYTSKEMHRHSLSEHLIDGQRFSTELLLGHKADHCSTVVNGILYQNGNSPSKVDPFLAKLGDALKRLAENNQVTQVDVGILNTEPLTQNYRRFYRYLGSFTTPACKEDVIWTILGEVKLISQKQVASLKAPLTPEYKDNARLVQLLNVRQIELEYLITK
ncbi:hypothetical protein Ddye_008855 [Dipteronia dyeriana]|uniref:Alpha-carbonic anhydrase domain-containing protein n=1 Tax=Dipteronia dyeriana TaxID=168575 RepID=A0AAD9XAJ3_9ROSI|nr:hypothetical protein Ddye_008855 [Dipteronia dyeriana]